MFGEKYPDPVRVVAVAPSKVPEILSNPQDAMWNEYSVEFCGGTHLSNTKEAEAFALLSEEGIAKGIRRIVFVTQEDAKKAMADKDRQIAAPQKELAATKTVGGGHVSDASAEAAPGQQLRNELQSTVLP